ncbi:MAG: alpha/beta hydrolase-fold protein [Eubacteriales bacterium]|nr:alpha/beta hydrolase-fold protein [Eubacteriales bacterium]
MNLIRIASICLSSCLLFTGCGTQQAEASDILSVPNGYYDAAGQQGTLETFTYDTKEYIGNGEAIQSQATVYLPYGYDQNDTAIRYNILYLQHGAYGNERTWMYEYGDDFKNMIDHMVEDELIPPLIIVMPYLPSGNEWYHDTTPIFYSGELKNDLMPAIESHYHTYAEDTTDAGFTESRTHRVFGGFSAGGTTTWQVFLEGLDRFAYFMPMSGGLTLGGDGSTDTADARRLAEAAASSGYDKREYYIFAATGTRDVAYQGLSAQIEAMKSQMEAFDYTDTGFTDGNLMYYTVDGNRHDYPYTYEYVYNGLRALTRHLQSEE